MTQRTAKSLLKPKDNWRNAVQKITKRVRFCEELGIRSFVAFYQEEDDYLVSALHLIMVLWAVVGGKVGWCVCSYKLGIHFEHYNSSYYY